MSKLTGWVLLMFVGAFAAQSVAAQVPQVLYYKFNEGAGTTVNSNASPGQGTNPATISGTSSWVVPGQVGASALNFGGASHISTNAALNVPSTQSWTFEFWFRPNANTWGYLFGDGDNVGTSFNNLRCSWYNLTDTIELAGANDGIVTPLRITAGAILNTWHHFAFVYDASAGTITGYMDGNVATSGFYTPNIVGSAFIIGRLDPNHTALINGALDEFRFWTVARTQAQIQANMNTELGSTSTPTAEVRRGTTVLASGSTDSLGPLSVGPTFPYTWTVHNVGTANLDVTTATTTVNSGPVTATTTSSPVGTIAPNSSANFNINVQPTGGGNFQFTITITSNDPVTPTYTVVVTGSGVTNMAPSVSIPGGSSWVQVSAAVFELALDPGATFNDDLLVQDADNDDMTVQVTNPGASITGLTSQPVSNATPSGGATGISLLWTGTVDPGNVPGMYSWTIQADDQNGGITTFTAAIVVNDLPPTHTLANAAGGDGLTVSTPYTAEYTQTMTGASDIDLASVADANTAQTVTVSTVTPATTVFNFAVAGGFLNVAPNGPLGAGAVGVHSHQVDVTDGNNTVTVYVEITVNPTPLITTTSPLTPGEQGQSYGPLNFTATGGSGSLVFSAQSALPSGLTLSAGGSLSGIPSVNGTFSLTIRVTDSFGVFNDQVFSLNIAPPSTGTPTIGTTSPLPTGVVNQAYAPVNFNASGGAGGYTFAVTAGSLPPGMSLSAAGVLSGTPTSSGVFTFTVTVTDAAFASSSGVFDLPINSASGSSGGGGGGGGGGCTSGLSGPPVLLLGALFAFLALRRRRQSA